MQLRLYFTMIILLSVKLLFAQVYPDSLYDEEPEQKFPVGFHEPEYVRISATGQEVSESRVEPPFWWVDMADPSLQVVIYDQNIKDAKVSIKHKGVKLRGTQKVENPNYLFVDLEISKNAKVGTFEIVLDVDGTEKSYPYELKSRGAGSASRKGVDASDLIYLIMPDRFANGDPSNDSFDDMEQWGLNREKTLFRHGGDILGVMENLDYIQDLGITAIWLNPVLENNEPFESYHGYAITDHYNIDKRLGSNDLYKSFVDLCHERGIKVIKDVVYNHVGDKHWFIQDLPSMDWIHQFDEYTKTTYRAPTLMDPYFSESDQEQMLDGWFDIHMPDLNQKNDLLANYLIQNSLWWIEFAGLDGFRIDTYAYSDQDFMANLGKRLQKEYPNFSFFGETWVHGSPTQAQFTQNNNLREGYNSYLPGVTDFQLYYSILEALNQEQGWTSGIARVYFTLTKDFLYENPYRNVIFLDNHDLPRFYSVVNGDMEKFKSGITFLLTMRGVPMFYYGTEILLSGVGGAFGEAGRKDFPGGWENDPVYKFNTDYLESNEQEAYEFIKKLSNYRKNSTALQFGKLKHYIPQDGLYAYFRMDDKSKVMVVMNMSDKDVAVPMERFKSDLEGYNQGMNVISGEMMNLGKMSLKPRQSMILELKK